MHPDREIIAKLTALSNDFGVEANRLAEEAHQALSCSDYKNYFSLMRKSGQRTKAQVEVLLTQLDIAERDYDEKIKLYFDSKNE